MAACDKVLSEGIVLKAWIILSTDIKARNTLLFLGPQEAAYGVDSSKEAGKTGR